MKYIIVNTKNKLEASDAWNYYENIKKYDYSKVKFIICPTKEQLQIFKEREYCLGSQDLYEIKMLQENNVTHTICGHSYRRLKGESDKIILEKVNILQKNNIKPILCIGENEKNTNVKEILKQQIDNILKEVYLKNNLIIAYEPVWSIGTENTPSVKEIDNIINYLKNYLNDEYNVSIPIVYGGGINLINIKEINKLKVLDGFMISTSALNVSNLEKILELIEE